MVCGVLPVLNQITVYLWGYSWRVFICFSLWRFVYGCVDIVYNSAEKSYKMTVDDFAPKE